MTRPTDSRGTLVLVPNALDLGAEPQPLEGVLPAAVIARAAALGHWVVEDARSARAFLKRVDRCVPLARPLQALQIEELPRAPKGRHEPITATQWHSLLAPALAGADLGLLSEAGLPGVADPGAELVAAAHAAELRVEVLAGPSSLLLALAASGLQGQSFAFVGYLPQEPEARRLRIRALEATSRKLGQTQIFIETPYRNQALLEALLSTLQPTTRLSLSVGLSLPQAWSCTRAVANWRQQPPALPDRMPAVFLLQA